MTVQQLINDLNQIEDKTLEIRRVDSYYSDQVVLTGIWLAPDDKKKVTKIVMIG